MDNLYKKCRVCMENGSRNIFDKSNVLSENIVSLDRLVEKLRFVACLQVSLLFFIIFTKKLCKVSFSFNEIG